MDAIVKKAILKRLYLLEESLNINNLSDCQNLLKIVYKHFCSNNPELKDSDIQIALIDILERHLQNIVVEEDIVNEPEEEFNETSERFDNIIDTNYENHSNSFQQVFSSRIFNPLNEKFHFHTIQEKR